MLSLMSDHKPSTSHLHIETFGNLLKHLRKRARLTQRELAIAVGYSEAHISRLERGERLPDLSTLAASFVPALELQEEPETIARFLELAAIARGNDISTSNHLTIVQSTQREVTQTLESMPIPSNLPIQLTSFIGRETEMEEITGLLHRPERVRLLTLLGAGGCGKTRLALQVAEGLAPEFSHGVWFVDLASLTNPAYISGITASALGISETHMRDPLKTLISFLLPRKALILFDNCEHILVGVAQLVESLLHACPQVQIIATSREILNIPGEKHFHVLPLAYPREGDHDRSSIAKFASVQLFTQRARSTQPAFELTDENAAPVAGICRRLEGIPLAIELAAARVGMLRTGQIETELKDRFEFLTSGRRTLPRHQTLRAMIDWSHDLLSAEERALFRRLAVFTGGWTFDAAASVCLAFSHLSVLNLLSRLVDKSFIVAERRPGEEARYTMLETLREYALEKLEAAQETSYALEQKFWFFHQLALQAQLYGPDKQNWLDRIEADYENIRAVVNWALTSRDPTAAEPYIKEAAELILALVDFFWFRGFALEARTWMEKLLAIPMPASPLRALLLQKSGWFARGSGDFTKADLLLHQALSMAMDIGDKQRASWALGDLGLSARDQGKPEQALTYFSESLRLAQEIGEKRAIANKLYYLAELNKHDFDRAESLWKQGLAIHQAEGDQTHIAWGMEGLAGVGYLKRDFVRAWKFQLESLKIKSKVMDKLGIAYSLEGLAQIAAAEEEPEYAAVLWGAADALRKAMQTPVDPSRADLYTSLIPKTREEIGENRFDELWERGKLMELKDAVQYALQIAPNH